jgi:Family of unknown function (DUF5335)
MSTQKQIPKVEWENFFKTFSRSHRKWLITVKENDVRIRNQPLHYIRFEDGDIYIGAGEHSIVVQQPNSVTLVSTDEGADQSIEIKTAAGTTSVIIESPALPEMVDGLP